MLDKSVAYAYVRKSSMYMGICTCMSTPPKLHFRIGCRKVSSKKLVIDMPMIPKVVNGLK